MVLSRIRITALGTAVLGCAIEAACGPPAARPRPLPEVGVVVIRAQPVELTTVLPGRVDPFATSAVVPQVSGILKSQLFKEGSDVRAGQPLYQIDPAPYKAAYDSAVAALADAKAKAARYRMLLNQNAIAPQDYDDAEATYKQDRANVETAHINLGYTRITAPISGRISRSALTQGALVTANQSTALATIETLDPIYVDIVQSSSELLSIRQSMQGGNITQGGPSEARVTLQLDNGTQYPIAGTLEFHEVIVDPNTGAVTLRAIFRNPDGILLPGMFVRATIVEGIDKNAILAPQEGVSRNEKGEPTAEIVDAHGIARLRILKTSRTIGDKWLVTDGLEPGDRLIVEGLQRAAPDTPVHAVPASNARAHDPDTD